MSKDKRSAKQTATEWLGKKLPFDYAYDVCGYPVGKTKYVMISQREWREIRACLEACAK